MKEFNIVIAGVGGQGVLTIEKIIADAALMQGYDVKASELHGLAQRGGSVPTHIRFGKKIHSSVIMEGEAHLVIGLETLEALRACYFGSKDNKTIFVVDDYKLPPANVKYPEKKEILRGLEQFSKKLVMLNAKAELEKSIPSCYFTNTFILGYAARFMPIKEKYLIEAIRQNVSKKYFEINKKVFELGLKS